jgi:hypothetical protein
VLLEPVTAGAEVVAGRMGRCDWLVEEFVEVVLVLVFELVLADRRDELGVTVESCSCISIMWSPSRIVRFRGAFPERKSFTCNIAKTNACVGSETECMPTHHSTGRLLLFKIKSVSISYFFMQKNSTDGSVYQHILENVLFSDTNALLTTKDSTRCKRHVSPTKSMCRC